MCDLHKSEIRNPKSGINYIDLLGKPFEYGGRGPDAYDCWGLCMEIYKRLGIQLPDGISTPEHKDIEQQINEGFRIQKLVETGFKPVCTKPVSTLLSGFKPVSTPTPYCLVTFMIRPPYTSHVGVALEDGNKFIHIMQKCRVAVERLDNLAWHRRIKGFYAYNSAGGDTDV